MSQSIDEVLLGTPARGAGGEEGVREEEGEGDKFVRQLFESLLLGTRASRSFFCRWVWPLLHLLPVLRLGGGSLSPLCCPRREPS